MLKLDPTTALLDRPPSGRAAVVPFIAASVTGSFLLFLVQPIVAKMLLPMLGGAPSVWNTSMVFFQIVLVAGYACAHVGMRLLPPVVQRRLQILILALPLLTLPVALPSGWDPPTTGSPMAWTLVVLALTVGPPFLVLSTCSTTLQHWFATSERTAGRDPYFLYAAGNAGSLLALLSYPLLIEPRLSTDGQARLFTAGYVVLVVLSAMCAFRRIASTEARQVRLGEGAAQVGGDGVQGDDAPTWSRRMRWVAWSLVPSALMLAVTRHLSTDVMSVPLLWIVPLSVYLLTFIAAFAYRADLVVRFAARGARFAVIPLVVTLLIGSRILLLEVPAHLLAFALIALLGHGRLAADRPSARHLTEFYLWVSIGGALGGIATSLVAPLIFPTVIEYPLAIAAGMAMVPDLRQTVARARLRINWRAVAVAGAVAVVIGLSIQDRDHLLLGPAAGLAGVVAYIVLRSPRGFATAIGTIALLSVAPHAHTMTTERSFFGVTTVAAEESTTHVLYSGTTVHGVQDMGRSDPVKPLAYYHPAGPLGGLLSQATERGDRHVGIVGLGAGSIAGYGRTGDRFDFYEIDPAVVRIAQNPRYFTYLSESDADIDIVMGDGRLSLERTERSYDVLVLDAFSSDSIPVHLLTSEAMATYKDRLAPDGVLAVHISNRYFDLEPVVARLARERGLAGVVSGHHPTPAEAEDGDASQVWVFLAAEAATLTPLTERSDVRLLDPAGRGPLWTDDFSNILSALDLG